MRLSPVWLALLCFLPAARAQPAPEPGCELVARGYGPRGQADVHVEVVASGLEVPWGLAFLPDRSMLVTERPGRIRRIVGGKLLTVARVRVTRGTEGGLLGLALHPDFARDRFFYVYYTADTPSGPKNRVERWQLSADFRSARPDRVILDGIPAARYHDGGRIAFGPDGKLYVGTGDGTRPELAQDPRSLAGKILRLDPDGKIPSDNPTRGSPVYVAGVRNVEALAWRADGTLAIAVHGPSGELGRTGHDQVALVRAGANLGWPVIFGCQARPGLASAALSWNEAVPPGGAVFYDGPIRAWRGDLLIGTLKSHHLHRVRFGRDGRVVEHDVNVSDHGRLRTVMMGPDHQLYIATSNCDGRGTCPRERDVILRVTP